ncbi:hypothetical protein HDV00_005363 [Rhizophlyctis rosea]|nr:hypothetical protein HDV00_005363 [Rhizophlyctis rosea]
MRLTPVPFESKFDEHLFVDHSPSVEASPPTTFGNSQIGNGDPESHFVDIPFFALLSDNARQILDFLDTATSLSTLRKALHLAKELSKEISQMGIICAFFALDVEEPEMDSKEHSDPVSQIRENAYFKISGEKRKADEAIGIVQKSLTEEIYQTKVDHTFQIRRCAIRDIFGGREPEIENLTTAYPSVKFVLSDSGAEDRRPTELITVKFSGQARDVPDFWASMESLDTAAMSKRTITVSERLRNLVVGSKSQHLVAIQRAYGAKRPVIFDLVDLDEGQFDVVFDHASDGIISAVKKDLITIVMELKGGWEIRDEADGDVRSEGGEGTVRNTRYYLETKRLFLELYCEIRGLRVNGSNLAVAEAALKSELLDLENLIDRIAAKAHYNQREMPDFAPQLEGVKAILECVWIRAREEANVDVAGQNDIIPIPSPTPSLEITGIGMPGETADQQDPGSPIFIPSRSRSRSSSEVPLTRTHTRKGEVSPALSSVREGGEGDARNLSDWDATSGLPVSRFSGFDSTMEEIREHIVVPDSASEGSEKGDDVL